MTHILVTGGAGYIGSHMVKLLDEVGLVPVTLDDLSNGYRDAVLAGEFVQGDIGDAGLLDQMCEQYDFTAIMHFAGAILVEESMRDPQKYIQNNVEKTQSLIEQARRHEIPHFIFSSSAAVYGNPEKVPIDEAHPTHPVNVYGETKQVVEEILTTSGLGYGILRYFNAAGADPGGAIGERHDPETHLIPLVLQAALGKREQITIYGDDYDTEDGTCVRDYIHVSDLCDAHLKLLDYLKRGGQEHIFNLGTGQGYSVKQVIEMAEGVVGKPIPQVIEGRREGDPAVLIADGNKAQEELGWQPLHSDLETILSHAWKWEKKRP